MTIQNERPQSERLARLGLRIVTTFWDDGGIRRRSSDHALHDDIVNGVIMDKQYFRGEQLLHTEKAFNPLLKYTFVIREQMEKEISCPNCGKTGKTAEFADGCPYCGTCYNIGYGERKDAGKLSAEKKSLPPAEYLTALVILLFVFWGLGLLFVRISGRTFGLFDILKGLAFGTIAGLLAFYVYYTSRVSAIVRKEEESYQEQMRQIRTLETGLSAYDIPVSVLYTNLSGELNSCFFAGSKPENADIIDWDILDYDDYRIDKDRNNSPKITLSGKIRILRADGNRVRSGEFRMHAVMKPNTVTGNPLQPGANVLHCHRCGGDIDVTRPTCSHCGAPVRYNQRLYLDELKLSKK